MESGKRIAVIGDEDTVTGFLLAGVGHRNAEGQNFLVVKPGKSTCMLFSFSIFSSYSLFVG